MKLYLPPALQAQRRGRFLRTLLNIDTAADDKLPTTGMVLMTGEQLQSSASYADECVAWARQEACSLLLMPPFVPGRILLALDWCIELSASSITSAAAPDSLAGLLAAEINYLLVGKDGSCVQSSMSAANCHTRYWKAHANSGLLAVTSLPLWSISLLGQGELVMDFLRVLEQHCGKPAHENHPLLESAPAEILQAQDVTVLVCCYGFALGGAAALATRLTKAAVPLLNLASFDLPESFARLQQCGMLADDGVSAAGLAFLQASSYWPFAEHLKKEA